MKKLGLMMLFGVGLVGCELPSEPENSDVGTVPFYVFNDSKKSETSESSPKNFCWSSCKLAWKNIDSVQVSPEAAKELFDVVNGKLLTYEVQSEDGREFVVDSETFQNLAMGDSIPYCQNMCK